jgi:hypothetical protein
VHGLRVFENGVLRKIFGPRRENVPRNWRRLFNDELHNLHALPNILLSSSSSFLGSTAQLRPWPPPQNPAEFRGDFSTIFFFYRVGLLAPRPTPIPEVQASVFISPRGRVATHFSHLLRHSWVTVGLFLFPGHHTGTLPNIQVIKSRRMRWTVHVTYMGDEKCI